MFEAAEGFVEFVHVVLKVVDVSAMVNNWFCRVFFNGGWNDIVVDWAFLELLDFVLEAAESFVEFVNTVLKVVDVGVVGVWCFNCAFFNGCWDEVLGNWAFLEAFDFILQAADIVLKW